MLGTASPTWLIFFGPLLTLEPNQGCKGVILSHGQHAERVPCPEAAADIDTPEDCRVLPQFVAHQGKQ